MSKKEENVTILGSSDSNPNTSKKGKMWEIFKDTPSTPFTISKKFQDDVLKYNKTFDQLESERPKGWKSWKFSKAM